jgi:hypothetical protein
MIEPSDLHFTPSRPAGCPTRFRLERYLAGELEAPEATRLETHLQGCEACRALRASIEGEKAAFQAAVPFDAFLAGLEQGLARAEVVAASETASGTVSRGAVEAAPGIASRGVVEAAPGAASHGRGAGSGGPLNADRLAAPPAGSVFQRLVGVKSAALRQLSSPAWAGAAVAMALLAVVVLPRIGEVGPYVGERGQVIEPGPLDVYVLRQGAERAELATSGGVFHAGDRLQFLVRPGSRRYLQLFSLDAAGHLSPFYPEGNAASIHLGGGAEQLLSGSIRLDDYVGLERIFALYSDEPIDPEEIEAAVAALMRRERVPLALERITRLPVPGTSQVTFLTVKE